MKYAHIDRFIDIFVIPGAIFQAGAHTFSSVGALDTLIGLNPGFCDNHNILILPVIWRVF